MSRLMPEPKMYTHQRLMDRLNELMIAIKLHHHVKTEDKGVEDLKQHHPVPKAQELNELQNEINNVLKKDFIGRKW